jgi:hypothetical protein
MRTVLHWSALLAGGVFAASPAAGPDAVAGVNLELVTLTETSAVFTWYTGVPGTSDAVGQLLPAPCQGEVVYGTHPARLDRTAYGAPGTAYHYVEIEDLEPGQTYYYQARARGRAAGAQVLLGGCAAGTPARRRGVFRFTAPQPPPGRYLFSIALANDLHLGETTVGLSGRLPWLKGVSQLPGRPPYPQVMAEALVRDARSRGADHLLIAGDLTADGRDEDIAAARTALDRFGALGRDYLVVRGNHDRPGQHPADPADAYRARFAVPQESAYHATRLNGLRVIGLDTYDDPAEDTDTGMLSASQLSWFRRELADDPDRPTLVFGHHPLLSPGNPLAAVSSPVLHRPQAQDVLRAYAAAPGVFLHHAGHTHRNRRSIPRQAPRVVHQEVAAAKEYPGGFALLRVHSGGYALNYYKTRDERARAWGERSRRQARGWWPHLAFGPTVGDRNSVVRRDFSGLGARADLNSFT